jgi:predicted glutamine amidotransferase
MCIIVYKPSEAKLPDKQTLKKCWKNNPDGAGYMFPSKDTVVIKKGFMSFNEFYKQLVYDKNQYGEFTPFVMHFRVSTQAGVNKECTHPFPLSEEMDNLKKLRVKCQCGIAHNGVIDLTSDRWNKTITYSDTMKFITDYLTLIITTKDWYKDKGKLKLIEKLAESKLAIMMGNGHVELIGDFIEENGIFYSNQYYKLNRWSTTTTTTVNTRIYNSYSEYLNSQYGTEEDDYMWSEDDKTWYEKYITKKGDK